jgi:hypothetical protein
MKLISTRNYSVNITKTVDLSGHVGEDQTWETIEELWDDANLDLPVPDPSEWNDEQISSLVEAIADWDDREEEWPDNNGTVVLGKVV